MKGPIRKPTSRLDTRTSLKLELGRFLCAIDCSIVELLTDTIKIGHKETHNKFYVIIQDLLQHNLCVKQVIVSFEEQQIKFYSPLS